LFDLRFDPQITTLVGPSDVGKSSVLRALRWLATNRPLGDGFIREGTKQTTVKLKIDDQTVARRRGKGENSYKSGEQRYEAFGNDVPPAVAKLLNVDEVNFGGQHDAPFWFDLTPGEVARRLNKIVDLEAIDKAATDLAGRVRVESAKIGVVEERLEKARQEEKSLAYVTVMNGDLGAVERLEEERRKVGGRCAALRGLVEESDRCQSRMSMLKGRLKFGNAAAGAVKSAVDLGVQVDALRELVDDAGDAERKAKIVVPDMGGLDDLLKRAGECRDAVTALFSLGTEAHRAAERVGDAALELRSAQRRLREETKGRCPLCGGPLDG